MNTAARYKPLAIDNCFVLALIKGALRFIADIMAAHAVTSRVVIALRKDGSSPKVSKYSTNF